MTAAKLHPKEVHPKELHPKEHGAYAILAIPIATALVIGGITLPGISIALAAFAGFFAHEPLMIVLGRRGQRALQSTPAARNWLIALLSVAILFGGVAMFFGSDLVRGLLLVCLLFASIGFVIAVYGWQRSIPGQLWGVVALSFPATAILLSGNSRPLDAMLFSAVWWVGFFSTTIAVHSVIAAQKRRSRRMHAFWLAVISGAIIAAATAGGYWILVTLPMVCLSWFLVIDPPHARHLKRVGWTLVVGTVGTAISLAMLLVR